MKRHFELYLISLALGLVLAGCTAIRLVPVIEPPAEPEVFGGLPAAVEYNLGETTIVQERFAKGSRFREMPVRLNGLIAAPTAAGGSYPVVVIFHGNHPGCPIPAGDEVDRWPCAPEDERPNYRGFAYLVRRLAAEGYVALSININAENTFGFGEPVPGERLQQLVTLHLQALAAAAEGGPNDFGLELAGRVDLHRLALFGHSRGGEAAYSLAHTDPLNSPEAPAGLDYGPVAGLLLIAPAIIAVEPVGSAMPMAVILPACDGDVAFQEGQHFYEAARLAADQTQWAASVWLEHAGHNAFNELLADEARARPDRPDCAVMLKPDAQRNFLADYALDFLAMIFGDHPQAILNVTARLGMDVQSLAADELFGAPARIASLAARSDRQPLLIPSGVNELTTHLAGGSVIAEGVTMSYCEAGYYTPEMKPGSEPCKRVNLTIPGQPAMVVVSWSQPGAALRFVLPPEAGDLSRYAAFSLRAAVDPLSALNKADTAQRFTVQLTDRAGVTATVQTRPAEPALRFPLGYVEDNPHFGGDLFSGRVPLTTLRVSLSDFAGVDLSDIGEVVLLFDQSPSGALFMGDLEWVRPPAEQAPK
ncbi:MAG: hypothetical protein IT329_23230 [Caldilineaceae bacterium]|nr:hypothetical protein [Caldilineaceae bacterium]